MNISARHVQWLLDGSIVASMVVWVFLAVGLHRTIEQQQYKQHAIQTVIDLRSSIESCIQRRPEVCPQKEWRDSFSTILLNSKLSLSSRFPYGAKGVADIGLSKSIHRLSPKAFYDWKESALNSIDLLKGDLTSDYEVAIGAIKQIVYRSHMVLWLFLFLVVTRASAVVIRTQGDRRSKSSNNKGDKTGVVLTAEAAASLFQDVEQAEQAAKRLARSKHQLRALKLATNDAVVTLNVNFRVRTWNKNAEKIFKKSQSDMSDRELTVLFDEEDVQLLSDTLLELSETDDTAEIQVKWLSTDELGLKYLDLRIVALHSDGPVDGYIVIIRDISSHIRQLEELRSIIEATPNAIIICDRAGHVVQANRCAEQVFGYQKFELLGLSIEDLMSPEDARSHHQHRSGYFDNPRIRKMGEGRTLSAKTKSGKSIYVDVALAPLVMEGETFVISSVSDISARVLAENDLEQANKVLAQKHKEMEQFVYTVSHDLRSPLVTISAFSKKLIGMVAPDSEAAHKAERILVNADRMAELLSDLLQISRIMNRPLKSEAFSMRALINETVANLESVIQGAKVNIDVAEGVKVSANRLQIGQCLQNFLENAVKYQSPDHALVINISNCIKDGMVEIEVEDNGVGIDKKYHDKVFGLFERVETASEGNGIGLAVVKSIAEKHGGQVTVDSILGEGARFTLRLPADKV